MNHPRDTKEGVLLLLITGVRVGLIAATMVAIFSMVTFAQTPKSTIESTPTTIRVVVTNDSLKHAKKSTDHDISVQTDPPAGSAISATDNVEIQHRFNELRRELLDDRASYIDYWLAAIAIVLTFFGIVAVVAGYISFRRFREIETEAKDSARTAAEHAEEAKHLVDEIKKIRDESAEILQNMTAEDVVEAPEEAKQAAAQVVENPMASMVDKAIAQAVFLQQQGKRDEAIEKWRAVAHIAEGIDNDIAARAWFSVGYLLENPEDSISAYDRAVSLKSDFVEAYNDRGVAKAEQGHYEEAIADFDEAIRLRPDEDKAYNNRGNAKAEQGHYEEAIADFDEAIRLRPDEDKAYNNRGNAKAEQGHYEEAIADFDEAIRLRPDEAEAYNNRGNVKGTLGRYDSAIADYNEAIRLEPAYAEAYNNRGVTKGALGLIDEARQDFEKARDLALETGYNNLAEAAEQGLRELDDREDK